MTSINRATFDTHSPFGQRCLSFRLLSFLLGNGSIGAAIRQDHAYMLRVDIGNWDRAPCVWPTPFGATVEQLFSNSTVSVYDCKLEPSFGLGQGKVVDGTAGQR